MLANWVGDDEGIIFRLLLGSHQLKVKRAGRSWTFENRAIDAKLSPGEGEKSTDEKMWDVFCFWAVAKAHG